MESVFDPNDLDLSHIVSEICKMTDWYHKQIKDKIQQLPNMPPIACWNWFKHTNSDAQSTLNKKV